MPRIAVQHLGQRIEPQLDDVLLVGWRNELSPEAPASLSFAVVSDLGEWARTQRTRLAATTRDNECIHVELSPTNCVGANLVTRHNVSEYSSYVLAARNVDLLRAAGGDAAREEYTEKLKSDTDHTLKARFPDLDLLLVEHGVTAKWWLPDWPADAALCEAPRKHGHGTREAAVRVGVAESSDDADDESDSCDIDDVSPRPAPRISPVKRKRRESDGAAVVATLGGPAKSVSDATPTTPCSPDTAAPAPSAAPVYGI